MIGLNRLNIDEEAVVAKIGEKSRRLKDLGLVEGTKVKCVLRSPLGDPYAYKIRGAVVAIRKRTHRRSWWRRLCHERRKNDRNSAGRQS